MTEEEKDILILKILERPQSLTDAEISVILSDEELLDIYNTSLKVKDAVRPALEVNPAKEWELMKARIQSQSEGQAHYKDNENDKALYNDKNTDDSQSDKVRKSFFASFLHGISRKPVAAAVGTFVVAASLALGLLWNPEPIQKEGNPSGDGIAQNVINDNGTIVVTPEGKNNESENLNYPDNLDTPFTSEKSKNQTDTSNLNSKSTNSFIEGRKSSQYSPKKDNTNSSPKNISSTTEPLIADNNIPEPLIPSEGNSSEPIVNDITVNDIINPANQDLAYSDENLIDFDNSQLEGLLPEDWDIDQCLKLQQARIDNDLALAMAKDRKKEYEIYRENILLEYQISNPDSDEATLEEIRSYLDDIFGNLYSAIP